MAFNFTFADNQRLGLQIVGANKTGTSEQPIGFKRAVVNNVNSIAGEVMYIGRKVNNPANYELGFCYSFYMDANDKATLANVAGAPIFGVIIKDGNCDYIQTGGVAYVQADAPLTKLSKIYYSPSTYKVSTSAGGSSFEVKGAIAGDPNNKISVNTNGKKIDLYPIYLNNPHL